MRDESIYEKARVTFIDHFTCITRAGGIGLGAPVLAGPVFSQDKNKIPFFAKGK